MRVLVSSVLVLAAGFVLGCGSGGGAADVAQGVDLGSHTDVHVAVDTPVAAPDLVAEVAAGEPLYDPYMVLPTSELPGVRGMVVKRGQIHAHTAYSHDGCDEKIDEEGILDQECLTQFRYGACWTDMDFVFITDHDDFMADYEFPEILLYREDEGDELILRNGAPVANWVDCGDGTRSLFSAGVDTKLLAIGLERHVREDIAERYQVYSARTPEAIAELHEAGALVVSAYSDEWNEDQLYALPLDGYEVYNPVTNLRTNMAATAEMVARMFTRPDEVPVPEIGLVAIFQENQETLRRWAKLLRARPVFSFVGTNAHQNVFKDPTSDGERLDSWRRLFHWFSNYVLVPDDVEIDDRVLLAAVGAGRSYGVVDMLGYPVGFDFHATVGGVAHEMGSRLPLEGEMALHVALPRLYGAISEGADAPVISGRILRVTGEDGWEVVAREDEDFTYTVTEPGIYRADIRIVPHHLRPWLGTEAERFEIEYLWIYANPIFVGVEY